MSEKRITKFDFALSIADLDSEVEQIKHVIKRNVDGIKRFCHKIFQLDANQTDVEVPFGSVPIAKIVLIRTDKPLGVKMEGADNDSYEVTSMLFLIGRINSIHISSGDEETIAEVLVAG